MNAELSVLPAARAQLTTIATIMSRAFIDDPVYVWLLPDPARRRRGLPPLFRAFARHLHHGLGSVEIAARGSDSVGAAIWDSPGNVAPGFVRTLYSVPGLLRATGLRLPALAYLGETVERARPEQPHWYLFHIAVDPDVHGGGAGTMLVNSVLARCDQAGFPAYLECKPSLIGYYQRFGFQTTHEIVIVKDAVSLVGMWRVPG